MRVPRAGVAEAVDEGSASTPFGAPEAVQAAKGAGAGPNPKDFRSR